MGLLTNNTPGAAISDIDLSAPKANVGQVQKVIFQRIFSTGTTKNKFVVASDNPNVISSWSPYLTATDGTKVVQSPYLQAPNSEPGAPRTYGGGNETLDGIELILGREPTSFTSNILQASQKTIEDLKRYQIEDVGVWLVDNFGNIFGLADNVTTPTEYTPIPIRGLFVGDDTLGGLENPDMNALSWKFLPNWSDKLAKITPTDFNALVDLVNS